MRGRTFGFTGHSAWGVHNPVVHRQKAGFPVIEKNFSAFASDWKSFPENKQDKTDDKTDGKQNGWPKVGPRGQPKTGPLFVSMNNEGGGADHVRQDSLLAVIHREASPDDAAHDMVEPLSGGLDSRASHLFHLLPRARLHHTPQKLDASHPASQNAPGIRGGYRKARSSA